MRRTQGFTLLEIMVVIVILGLLAAMVVPNLMGNKEQADRQKVVVDIQQLESMLDLYKMNNGFYPTTEQSLQALVTQATSEPMPRSFPDGGYIKRLPQDPWGSDYQMVSPGEMGKIDVFSAGPDRTVGTDDDIGNWNLDGKKEQQN
ncbi:MAG TPA: type II secretion system protein GspG [Rheinheimera sp.]|nr:type II secretion system protein GspG [Rheinheimera sp.]